MPCLLWCRLCPFEPTGKGIFFWEICFNCCLCWIWVNLSINLGIYNSSCWKWNLPSLEWRWFISKEFFVTINRINKSTYWSWVDYLSELSIKTWISILIFSSQNKFKIFQIRMFNREFSRHWIQITKFDYCNSLSCIWVWEIEMSPKTFNISRIINISNHIWISWLNIIGSEVIISLSLPDCQDSVSHSNIVIIFMLCQSCHKVPRSIFTIR